MRGTLPSDVSTLFDFFNSVSPLSSEIHNDVIEVLHRRAYSKGETILSVGQVDNKSQFVIRGVVLQSVFDEDAPVTVNITPAGLPFNSLKSYIEGSPSIETHEALTEVEVFYILKKDLEALTKKHHEFCLFMFKLHEGILMDRENRMFLLQYRQPSKRLRLFMENVDRANAILQHTQDKHIASYLNMTPQQYSREKKKYYREVVV